MTETKIKIITDMTETKIKIITENRKARHDYNIVEAMEAGMELVGTEVKSLRAGKVNLKDSFVRITKKGELVVMNMHISPYDFGNYNNHDPLRTRRLLMHRREIDRLLGKVKEKGYSLIPLKLYFRKWNWRFVPARRFTTNAAIWQTGTRSVRCSG